MGSSEGRATEQGQRPLARTWVLDAFLEQDQSLGNPPRGHDRRAPANRTLASRCPLQQDRSSWTDRGVTSSCVADFDHLRRRRRFLDGHIRAVTNEEPGLPRSSVLCEKQTSLSESIY